MNYQSDQQRIMNQQQQQQQQQYLQQQQRMAGQQQQQQLQQQQRHQLQPNMPPMVQQQQQQPAGMIAANTRQQRFIPAMTNDTRANVQPQMMRMVGQQQSNVGVQQQQQPAQTRGGGMPPTTAFQQQQRTNTEQFMARLPIEWQTRIRQAAPEERRSLFQAAQEYMMRSQQQQQQQQSTFMTQQPQPYAPTPGGAMQQQQQQPQFAMGQQRMQMQQQQPYVPTNNLRGAPMNTAYAPQQQQSTDVAYQQRMIAYQQQQQQQQQQPMMPSTTDVPDGGPSSVPGATAQSQEELQAYEANLNILRQYSDTLKRNLERNRIDGVSDAKNQKLERLLEVIERKRVVPLTLLKQLVKDIKKVYDQSQVCYLLNDAVQTHYPAHHDLFNKRLFADPWTGVGDHLRIAVPAEYKEVSMKMESDESMQSDDKQRRYTIECLDGSQLQLSMDATRHLAEYNIRLNREQTPLSATCKMVDMILQVDDATMYVPPLMITVPVNYPIDAVRVSSQGFESIGDSPLLNQLRTCFITRLCNVGHIQSIGALVAAWKASIDHVKSLSSENNVNRL